MGQVRHIKGTKNKLSSSFLKEDDIAHAVDRGELVLTDVDGNKTFLSNNGYYGDTSSTGAAGAFSVTIEGIKELYQGLKITLHLKKATSATGNTLNINGLGNTPIFKHLAEPLTDILPAGGVMQLVYSDTAAGFIITSPINDKKYIPYTGADKAINLNSQEVIHAGKKRLDIGSFTFKDLSTSATGGINRYIEYEDIATLQEPIATGLRLIRVEIPITTNTQWNMVIDLLGNIHTNANQSNTTLKIQGYGVSNTHTYVNTDNPNYIKGVRFGRNSAGTKTVVIIETSTIYNHPRIILRTVGFTIALPDTMFSLTKSDFGLSTVLEADITDTIQATILNKDFVRDSFYMGYIPYAGATKAIDINNQNFSHNGKLISGAEKLDIKAYAGTKKYIQPKGVYSGVGASFAGILQVRLSIRNRILFDCKVNITDSTTTAGLGGHSTLYLTGFSYNGTSLTMCRVTTDNPNNFLKVDFGLNAAADVVINIYSADGKFYYPSAEIEWVRTGFQEDTRLENISNYGLDFLTVAAATTDFNVAQTVLKADFVKGADFSNYYSKTDADDRFAKNGNVYSKTEANDLFVGVNSVQTIVGLKTFTQIPLAPAIEPSLPNHLVRKQYVDDLSESLYSLLSYDGPFGLAISTLEGLVEGLQSVVNAAIPFGYIMAVDPKSLNLKLRAGMIWYGFDDWGDIETTAPYTPYKQLDKDLIWRTVGSNSIPEGVNFYCVLDNTILVYANKRWHTLVEGY